MNISKSLIAVVLAAGAAACTEDDYKLYDTGQKDAVFFEYRTPSNAVDTATHYAFNYDIGEEHVIEVPVILMGMPSSHDRTITVNVVPEKTDMNETTNYVIDEAVLPAGEVKTSVKIHLVRNADERILTDTLHMRVRLAESNDLRPTGQTTFDISYSDVRPEGRPSWWTTYSAMPVYSFEAAQLFFKYFYELAPALPDVYKEMIKLYGDYFVNAVAMRGPLAMYDNFLARYVLIPMYNDTKDQLEWQSVPTIH